MITIGKAIGGGVPVGAYGLSAEPEDFLHTYLLNRGVLLTPFHNMALMCPRTTTDDVARHHEIFAAALGELLA